VGVDVVTGQRDPSQIVAELVHEYDRVDVFKFMHHMERVEWIADVVRRTHPHIDRETIALELARMAGRWQRRPRRTSAAVVGTYPAQSGDEIEVPDTLGGPSLRHPVDAWAILASGKVAAVLRHEGAPGVYDVSECITHRRPKAAGGAGQRTDPAVNGRRRLPPLTEVKP
jgi:hypothetical protein